MRTLLPAPTSRRSPGRCPGTLPAGTTLLRRALFLAALFALLPPSHAAPAEFFVAPDGRDTHPGTQAQPFATLERARDAVRQLRAQGAFPAAGVTVWLRGGDYLRTNAFALSAADRGEPEAPIRYQGWAGEVPRLLGGRTLRGFLPVADPAVLARLDEAARPHVVSLDLRAEGLADVGDMQSRGFGRPTAPAHCELFFNGRPLPLARWPNEGAFAQIAGFPESGARGDDHGGQIGRLEDGFHYAGDRPRRWQQPEHLWVHGYWAWDWANSYERVVALDLEQRLVRTAPPHGLYGFRNGQRFHFLNVLEELDQPGEWFLDRRSGRLYLWPPSPVERAEILLSLLGEPLLRLENASHLEFRRLVLEAGRAHGIAIRDGTGVRIESCVLRNLGNAGVAVAGGRDHRVTACDVFDTGDGGVSLAGGDRQTLAASGHAVENCHFARQGRWSKCYVPAILFDGVGHRASHNLIHDHPHCAILFNGNDHLIEYNEIHHIALETGDVGAIYSGRDYTYRGNRIRHNFIHHTGGVGMGSMGVYMDDCVSGAEVVGNVFYQVHWAMFIGGGRDMRVQHNVFVECDPAVRADGRGLDRSPVWRNMVDKTMRERLQEVPLALYRERYPALQTLDRHYGPPAGPPRVGEDFRGVPPEGNLITHNVCVGKWLELGWHAPQEGFEVRDNYVGPDPGFVSVPAMNFRLRPDARGLPAGFQPPPVDQIGLRPDQARRVVHQLQPPVVP